MGRKFYNYQLLVDKKPREKPFASKDAARDWARDNLAKEIKERRVQIAPVEAYEGAAQDHTQKRRDRFIKKATGFKTEAAYERAWSRQRSKS